MITFLHIVLGELAPKGLALLHPERTSRWVAPPLILFTKATNPFIWLLNGTANAILRLFGTRAPSERERVHSPEEIMMLVEQTRETGRIDAQDARMIGGVFEFTEANAREVMTPRTDMSALDVSMSLREAANRVRLVGRSRYPVYRESLDDIVGTVQGKDVLAAFATGEGRTVEDILRPTLFVPSTREVEEVLADMRRQRTHLAIVLDEFGGTAGLVTMEDLLKRSSARPTTSTTALTPRPLALVGRGPRRWDGDPGDERTSGPRARRLVVHNLGRAALRGARPPPPTG